jgi:hypothetical protein
VSLALLGALLEVQSLAPLAGWEPVGIRLQALVDAARGVGAIGERDLYLLRCWAAQWQALSEEVRAFYLRHLDEQAPTARVVLWHVLNGRRPQSWQIRILSRIWLDDTGLEPVGVLWGPKKSA